MDDILEDGNADELRRSATAEAGFTAQAAIGDTSMAARDGNLSGDRAAWRRSFGLPRCSSVGRPRSGTTLVQTMLDSHPRMSVLYEADALVDIPLGLRSRLANASEALTLAEAHPNSRSIASTPEPPKRYAENSALWTPPEPCGYWPRRRPLPKVRDVGETKNPRPSCTSPSWRSCTRTRSLSM